LIPLRHHELRNSIDRREPIALILTPTKELGEQVANHINSYISVASSKNTDQALRVRTGVIIGGVGKTNQLNTIRKGLDIIVATPGRLLELLKANTSSKEDFVEDFDSDLDDPNEFKANTNTEGCVLNLSKIEFLVVDECDKMLNMGFVADLREIYAYLPKPPTKSKKKVKRISLEEEEEEEEELKPIKEASPNKKPMQVMMFSATLTRGVEDLMIRFAPQHKLVNLNADMQVAGNIKHVQYRVSSLLRKYSLLKYLLKRQGWKNQQVLVFSRTRQKADRLAERLQEEGIDAFSVHKGRSVAIRSKAIQDFKDYPKNLQLVKQMSEDEEKPRLIQVLISTDVLARGIDVENLPFVVNYDVPSQPEDYVHRVGRTGRAGHAGMAVSLVNVSAQVINIAHQPVELNELHFMNTIERFIKQRVEHRKIPGPWTDPDLEKVLEKDTSLPTLVDKMMVESRQRGLEILVKKQEKFKQQMENTRKSISKNPDGENAKKLQRMSESYYRLKQRAGQIGTDVNSLVEKATLQREDKTLASIPTLRNFKEGRYEDVVAGFEKHRALSRGAIKEQIKWKSGRKRKRYTIV
jgi:superfamily II DNA/RNA helicase